MKFEKQILIYFTGILLTLVLFGAIAFAANEENPHNDVESLYDMPKSHGNYGIKVINMGKPIGIHNDIDKKTQNFTSENMWGDEIDKEYIKIYAGALENDPSQGVIVVINESSEDEACFAHLKILL